MGSVIVLSEAAVLEAIAPLLSNLTINVSGELVMTKQDGTSATVGYVRDHSELLNLTADDHTQYALADGTRGDFASEAQGAKADAARKNHEAVIDVTGVDGSKVIETATVTNDGTATSGWPDRRLNLYKDNGGADPRRVSWDNEYLEKRGAPAKHNTVAHRWFVEDDPTNTTGTRSADVPVIELMDNAVDRNSLWGIVGDGTTVVNSLRMAYVLVLDDVESVPAGTPAGTVIVREAP